MKKISTCLWFNIQAEQAVEFYAKVFKNTKILKTTRYSEASAKVSGQKVGSTMTIDCEIEDLSVLALNGGPQFKFSPSLSVFVGCTSENEITEKWKMLSQGGVVRMGLDKYPWAEKYGWTTDQFGVEWQLIHSPRSQKIVPAFLFVDSLFGRGDEAIDLYTSLFPNSNVEFMARDEKTKSIQHCAFTLGGQGFVLMEGTGQHGHTFSHATSLTVQCENQGEIDRFYDKLSSGGSTEPCGWLKDKFGVSWQIVPAVLGELMTNPEKSEKVMQALLKMKKIDLAALLQAAK